jgi:hypothetical protein
MTTSRIAIVDEQRAQIEELAARLPSTWRRRVERAQRRPSRQSRIL